MDIIRPLNLSTDAELAALKAQADARVKSSTGEDLRKAQADAAEIAAEIGYRVWLSGDVPW